MDEESRFPAFEKKFQDSAADAQIQVESAIDKFELSHATIQKALHGGQEWLKWDGSHGNVQRAQAELTRKWATTRGFDINHPMLAIVISIQVIGKGQLVECRKLGNEYSR